MVVSCASLYHTAGLPGRFITYVSVMLHVTLCTRGSSFRYVLLTRGRPVAGAFCVTQLQHPRSLFLHSPLPMPVVAPKPPHPGLLRGQRGGQAGFMPAFWTLPGSAGMGMCGSRKAAASANGSRAGPSTHKPLTRIHNLIMTSAPSICPQSRTAAHMWPTQRPAHTLCRIGRCRTWMAD